jgi:general secretion pathway protein D
MDHKAFDFLATPFDDYLQDLNLSDEADLDETPKNEEISQNFYRNISISVTENMQLRNVLVQMANLAGVNIFIAQDVMGNISFSAKDRPFLDILKDICSSLNFKYSLRGNSVKIEYNSPTLQTYNISSLNILRDTKSSMSIATDIFSGDVSGFSLTPESSSSNASKTNGSSSSVTSTTRNDFWMELESTLKAIVGNADGNFVTVHRQGGLITVCTTQEKHEEIQNYLGLLKEMSEAQVLIEAKILEINLKDEFKSGVNWSIMRKGHNIVDQKYSGDGLFSIGVNSDGISLISKFLEGFGAVKTLSSPRITVLNNHSAVFKVAQNEVIYMPEFQKQYSSSRSDALNTDLLSANVKTIPIGLVMTVQPSIDRKNNTILLTLRPTISKIANYKEVPFLFHNYSAQGNNTLGSPQIQMQKIPIVDVRELDSVLRLKSGQIAVMGGLMQEKSLNSRKGIPHMENTPVDFITGSREKNTEVTELVIFLKATILRNKSKMHHKADQKIYEKFSSDPRPLRFENDTTTQKQIKK